MLESRYLGRSSNLATRLSSGSSLSRREPTSALLNEKKAISEADITPEKKMRIRMIRLALTTMPVGALIKACKRIERKWTGPVFKVI
jgi:hypothetical protein